jgi:hypothetical protein
MGGPMLILAHIRSNFAAAFFPRMSEWAASVAVFCVGLILSANPSLMASTTTKAYGMMLLIASQPTWASALMLFGGARLLVLAINGAWRRSPHARTVMAVLSCFPLYTIAMSFLPTRDIAMVLAFVILGMDVVNAVRAAGDARTIDYAHAMRGLDGRQQLK